MQPQSQNEGDDWTEFFPHVTTKRQSLKRIKEPKSQEEGEDWTLFHGMGLTR